MKILNFKQEYQENSARILNRTQNIPSEGRGKVRRGVKNVGDKKVQRPSPEKERMGPGQKEADRKKGSLGGAQRGSVPNKTSGAVMAVGGAPFVNRLRCCRDRRGGRTAPPRS